MHKQHPQTAYRKDAVLIGTIFENCDKRRGYGSQQTDLSELRTQNEIAVHSEKRDFKISDVLITAWSRVQVLPGPPSPYEKRHLAMRCLFFIFRTAIPTPRQCRSGKVPFHKIADVGKDFGPVRLHQKLVPGTDRKSTRVNSSHRRTSRMPSSA